MKALVGVVTFGAILSVLTGCEGNWQVGSSAANYNTSGKWADVSGTYVGLPGSYLVSNYTIGSTTNSTSTSNTVNETIGTTTAGQTLYSGTLSSPPLAADSFAIAISGVAAGHDDGAGAITGSGITDGGIDYNTGAWNLSLSAAPPDGATITASYIHIASSASSSGTNGPGGSSTIYTFTVQQSGNAVSFTDNNGSIYKGNIGMTSTNIPGGGTNTTAISATYSYDVSGVSAAGYNVEMVGTFLVNGVSVGTNGTTVTGTEISGTWLEQHGKTGRILGERQ